MARVAIIIEDYDEEEVLEWFDEVGIMYEVEVV